MPQIVALISCIAFILALLVIERKENPAVSTALWIPTFWMLINASRPVASWFQYHTTGPLTAEMIEAGSPYDRMILSVLMLLAFYVLYKRKVEWALIIRKNSILIFLLVFAGLSILWSDFPFLSLKRWVRLAGLVPVAAVLLSERDPLQALKSIFKRCAYILLPLSIVLIKYYPHLGRGYGRWSGEVSWKGVTLTKNALGQLCMVSAFFFIWEFYRLWKKRNPSRTMLTQMADGIVLILAIFLLLRSGSLTSLLAFVAGVASLFLLYRNKNKARRAAALLIVGVVVLWVLLIIGGSLVEDLTQAVGRDPTFTARTSFWPILLAEGKRRPILGSGFGGYFGTPGNWLLETHGYGVGHNGLLDVFIELGMVGVILVVVFHLGLIRRFRRRFDNAFDWSVFGIGFLVISWLANFSESLFLKSSSYIWSITIVLSIVCSRWLNSDIDQNDTGS